MEEKALIQPKKSRISICLLMAFIYKLPLILQGLSLLTSLSRITMHITYKNTLNKYHFKKIVATKPERLGKQFLRVIC